MGYCKQTALPSAECVSLAEAKSFMRLPSAYTSEDAFITASIQAAREQGEIYTGRSLAKRTFVQVMDRFPDRTLRDGIDGSGVYGLGFFTMSLGNSSFNFHRQLIKLAYPPCISVQNVTYVDTNGNVQTLQQDTDFVLDRQTDFARLAPLPGKYWPFSIATVNNIEINFTAGYDSNPAAVDTHNVVGINPPNQQTTSTLVTGVPQVIRMAVLNLVAHWFQNRGVSEVPESIANVFRGMAVYQF